MFQENHSIYIFFQCFVKLTRIREIYLYNQNLRELSLAVVKASNNT